MILLGCEEAPRRWDFTFSFICLLTHRKSLCEVLRFPLIDVIFLHLRPQPSALLKVWPLCGASVTPALHLAKADSRLPPRPRRGGGQGALGFLVKLRRGVPLDPRRPAGAALRRSGERRGCFLPPEPQRPLVASAGFSVIAAFWFG